MKRQILFGLFLLTVFCAMPVFSQEKTSNNETLVTEFVKVKNLLFSPNVIKTESYIGDGIPQTNEQKAFQKIFQALSAERGTIEIDSKNSFLIITDTKKRVEFIKEFVVVLDNSNLTFDEIVSKSAKTDEKIIIGSVKAQNIFPIVVCIGYAPLGEISQPLWARIQGNLMTYILVDLLSKNGSVEFGKNEAVITETKRRFNLLKKLIELFDRPYLTEEFKEQ